LAEVPIGDVNWSNRLGRHGLW